MTIRDKATLKTYFQTGDTPTETQFSDLIDSVLSVKGGSIGDGVNQTTFESDGTMVAEGSATTWIDVLGNASNVKSQGAGVSVNAAEQTIEFLTTANPATDYAWFTIQIPHQWKVGTKLYPHIHWQQTANTNPNMGIAYRWQKNGSTTDAGTFMLDTQMTNVFTYTSGTLNQISHGLNDITPPVGAGLSDILQIRVLRDRNNILGAFSGSDTYNATVSVTSVDIHMECDTLGSRTQFTK